MQTAKPLANIAAMLSFHFPVLLYSRNLSTFQDDSLKQISKRSDTTCVSCPVALIGLFESRKRILWIPAVLAASISRLRSPT